MATTQITALNINGSGAYELYVGGTTLLSGVTEINAITYPNTDGTTGQVMCTNGTGTLGWTTVGGGGSSLWVNGTGSYIIPCNICSVCVTNTLGICSTILGASNCVLTDNFIGLSSASRTFISCIIGTACVCSPVVCAPRILRMPVGVNCY